MTNIFLISKKATSRQKNVGDLLFADIAITLFMCVLSVSLFFRALFLLIGRNRIVRIVGR